MLQMYSGRREGGGWKDVELWCVGVNCAFKINGVHVCMF